jgi:hypothetical protein
MSTAAHPDTPPAAHPEAVFAASWLELRAAADRAARAAQLEERLSDWLRSRPPQPPRALRIVDLGTGSGANPVHLASRLPGPQQWTLIDHDAGLLARALATCTSLRSAGGEVVAAQTLHCDLQLPASAFAHADLVCASALLDLVDAPWLERFAASCATAGCAVLVTLSVDGHWRFAGTPPTPPGVAAEQTDDDFVRAAFNAHQRRDKGLGPALGPDAAAALAACLRAHGFTVDCAPSPWQLALGDPAQARLARVLVDGWRDAASAQCPDAHARIAAWHARCVAERLHPGVVLEVGHLDVLGLPAGRASRAGSGP